LYKKTLEITKDAIKNGQSRKTGNCAQDRAKIYKTKNTTQKTKKDEQDDPTQ